MATAFQSNAFQRNAFQIVGAVQQSDRGFDETLAAFARQRRREREEREIEQWFALETQMILKALEGFSPWRRKLR